MPEWYVADDRTARRGAAVLIVVLVVVGAVWLRTALQLFSPPDDVCEGCATDWFRRTQLLIALAGVALSGVLVAYLGHIAATGRTWRRRRAVTLALGIAVVAWSALVLGTAWT